MTNAPGQPASAAPRSNDTAIAIALLGAFTIFRLWYVTKIGLVADEAYYWLWSKHLAASYTDKGPGIAWIIAAGTWVFGDTALGVRWLGVLLSAGIGWQIFRLARRLYDARTALWALVVACVIPIFGVGSVVMTIDTPSVFCWAWAANIFLTALETGKVRHWFALGLVIGAGFLAKFTNGVQLGCLALFLLWSAPHRKYLFSKQSFAVLLAFSLCSLPIIWWNYSVGWLQVDALHSRSGVKHSFEIHPLQFLQFFGEQIGLQSPLIGLGMIVAAVGLLFTGHKEMRVRFLLCQFVPIFALFGFFSLNAAGKGNWPVPGLVGGIIVLVVFWRGLVARRPGWRWAPWAALGLAGFMTLVLHIAPFISVPDFRFNLFGNNIHIPSLDKFTNRARGWPDYAAHIQRARDQYRPAVLMGDHYSTVSLAQFYLPDHPKIYQPTGWHPQFKLWGDYPLSPGTRALFITSNCRTNVVDLGMPFSKEFNPPELVDNFWSQENGRDVKQFQIYYLTARNP